MLQLQQVQKRLHFIFTKWFPLPLIFSIAIVESESEVAQSCLTLCEPMDCSVQFSRSVVSDSLQPHESQHTRPPCPSPTPGIHSNSCLLSQWCHPVISSSVIPFSSFAQSPPASESSPKSQLFAWGDQSTGVSASASFLPKNTQGWSPVEWTGKY